MGSSGRGMNFPHEPARQVSHGKQWQQKASINPWSRGQVLGHGKTQHSDRKGPFCFRYFDRSQLHRIHNLAVVDHDGRAAKRRNPLGMLETEDAEVTECTEEAAIAAASKGWDCVFNGHTATALG